MSNEVTTTKFCTVLYQDTEQQYELTEENKKLIDIQCTNDFITKEYFKENFYSLYCSKVKDIITLYLEKLYNHLDTELINTTNKDNDKYQPDKISTNTLNSITLSEIKKHNKLLEDIFAVLTKFMVYKDATLNDMYVNFDEKKYPNIKNLSILIDFFTNISLDINIKIELFKILGSHFLLRFP